MVTVSGVFDPERVAIVGATERDGSVGRAITENLLEDFGGEIVPVNPNVDRVFEVDCRDTVTGADVDLAVIAVPPEAALEAVETAGTEGIENIVVITAGFGETGSEGARRERRLQELAAEYDLNIVGPNSLGVISTPSGLNATFAPRNARPDTISFMSQSGALVTAILEWAGDRGIGFKDIVSLGNKAVLDETDFVETWGEDPGTDVVLGYLEGIAEGRQFIETTRNVTRETPVVVLKSGRTEAGARAASSHTGAIAGSERAYEAGLKKAGAIRVDSTEALFDTGAMLAGGSLPGADGVAVVTNAGGSGVIATDAIGDSRAELASFERETRDRLAEVLPETASVSNPVDVIGDASADRFRDALEIVLSDPAVGAAVVIACPSAVLSFQRLAEVLATFRERRATPLAVCLMGGDSVSEPAETLAATNTPTYFDPTRAIEGLDALFRYREIRNRPERSPTEFDVDTDAARSVLERVETQSDNRLGIEAMELLDAYGISTADSEIVDAPHAARSAAERFGGDVVMKIVSPDILHKTDIGGVEIGVALEDVEDTYESLLTRARNYQPDARIHGVQIQERIDIDGGVETIVGMSRDPQFGPVLLFGLGGVFVEVLDDTTVRIAPVSRPEAESMIEDIESTPLLRGARGREPADEAAIVETIERLSQLVTDFPSIVELDINPLVATPDGVAAIDLRLTVDPETL